MSLALLFLFIIPFLSSLLTPISPLSLFIPCTYLFFFTPVLDPILAVDISSVAQTTARKKKSLWFLSNWTLFVEGQRFYLFSFKALRLCKRSDLWWWNQQLSGCAPQMSLYPYNQWWRGKKVASGKHKKAPHTEAQSTSATFFRRQSTETPPLNSEVLVTW